MILAAVVALVVVLPAGVPGQPAPDAGWPQSVASPSGIRYELFAPWFTAYDGALVEVRHAVVRTDAGGTASTGEVTLRAAAEPGPVPGELELLRFEVTGLVLDGRAVEPAERAALSAVLSGRALLTTRQAVTHDLVAIDARAAVAAAGDPAPWSPAVIVADRHAFALGIDGDPRTEPLAGTGWLQVVNTPWVILVAPDGTFWVLCGSDRWMRSIRLDGGYEPTAPPPADVLAAVAAPSPAVASPDSSAAPAVFVVTQPTVVVWTQGAPAPVAVAPGVEWVPNAGPLVLRTRAPEAWWVLAAGTWLRADRLDAPWAPVAPADVPAEFALLPGGRVLGPAKASVPHTPEAAAAVAAAAERRTVTVRRAAAACAVTWGGAPAWQDVPGTPMRLATNASRPVLEADRRLWCCDDAVWFVADGPDGPWSVADALPDALDAVPAWSAAYPLSSVEVRSSDESSVTFSYQPGYFGTRIDGGAACFGSAAPADGDGGAVAPTAFGVPLSFDPATGTFGPAWGSLDRSWRPSVRVSVQRAGWRGWGVSPSFTAAWASCLDARNASPWPEFWTTWTPGSVRWADARTAAARARDAADRALVAAREPVSAPDPAPVAISDDESEWRRRVAEAGRRASRAAADERVDGPPRLVPVANPGLGDATDAAAGPRRGSSQWWYRYINDYTHGFLSRANGYRDPRAGAVDARVAPDAEDGSR